MQVGEAAFYVQSCNKQKKTHILRTLFVLKKRSTIFVNKSRRTRAKSDWVTLFGTLPDVARPTGKATYSLLPEKTKKRYEVSYVHFKNWCKKQGAKEITENVLLAYFAERSEHLKSSSLYSEYSKIKTSLAVRKEANIAVFTKVTQFLKNKSIGFCSEKSRTFSRSQMNAFLAEAPDDKFLMMKVISSVCVALIINRLEFRWR